MNWIESLDHNLIAEQAFPYLPSNPIILEAGANDGTDTMNIKRIWDSSTVYAFEPNPRMFQALTERITKTHGVIAVNKALSSNSNGARFYRSEVNEGASSLYADNIANIHFPDSLDLSEEAMIESKKRGYADKEINVQTITIDEYFADKQHPDFIWFDLEGAELIALIHGKTILPNVKAIITEVNFREFRKGSVLFDELDYFLKANGFRLESIFGNPEWQGTAFYVRAKRTNISFTDLKT
jgi:FkbM family methyltransferase